MCRIASADILLCRFVIWSFDAISFVYLTKAPIDIPLQFLILGWLVLVRGVFII